MTGQPPTVGQTPVVVPLRPTVNAEAVARARDLLEACEAGRVVEFFYGAVLPDGSVQTLIMATDDQQRRLAAACRLLHRMNVMMDDTSREVK